MTKKYYLCEIKQEEILAEFYAKDACENFIMAMGMWDDHHNLDNMGTYVVIQAASRMQADDMIGIMAHAQNCKYAAFLMEAKRLDEDDRVHIADKWAKLMRVMNASKFWQQD